MFEMPEIKRHDEEKIKLVKVIFLSPLFYYGIALAVIAASIGLHTLPNITKLDETKNFINSTVNEVKTTDDTIQKKEVERENAKQQLSLYQEKYSPRINKVFPVGEQIGPLTRFLENFALQLEKEGVMTLNAISYGAAITKGEYATLPIRLSFQADSKNFIRFMQLINDSGSIEEKDFNGGEPIRMMQVDQINVTIPNFSEGGAIIEEPLYSISIQVSAFHRNNP